MPLSPLDLADARETVEEMLAELDLEAVLFAVEHTGQCWQLSIECAAGSNWQSATIACENLPSRQVADAELREKLKALLEDKLAGCSRRGAHMVRKEGAD